jgi:hypothetical protein
VSLGKPAVPVCTCRAGGQLCRTCRAIRARLAKEHPPCGICGQPCVAGQKDGEGKAAHLTCQRLGYNPCAQRKEPDD